jgi:hypothetical protein
MARTRRNPLWPPQSPSRERQVDAVKPRGIGDQVGLDDLPARDLEIEDDTRLAAHGPRRTCRSVDERRPGDPGAAASQSRSSIGHIPSPCGVIEVTDETRPMCNNHRKEPS